ncbi:gliding motility lipoprotein GldH [Hymenobacter busanensis]|uniref:Gliding motility lipoprotein GldH n=1 Tax=Hymenobacter busanensis TaxID=2607656 RepID=A0A7L5A1I1_9BACT|nr:gliding motility lipoprotein GldH [Hymenobacter busanensis]KAA9338509.1 gliding motility lipoprotein GldH [Hymenobacter busanensis]QHJ09063.1 gliding motility lipoprotein GldH [Hymenobacter busanensis]
MNNLALLRAMLWLLVLPLLVACDPNRVYETNIDLPDYAWSVQNKPSFSFDIQDTTQLYDVYFNVRNASAYGYYNLYVKHTLTGPDGQVVSRLLHHMVLMDPKTGEPLGDGTGDIFDHQFLALPKQRFARPGTYTVVLEQYMRQDVLPGIMAMGVRVVKANEKAPDTP